MGSSKPASKKVVVKPITVNCSMSMTTVPPSGSNTVNQPQAQGNQYGPNKCPRKIFGSGTVEDSYTIADSGDTVGTYTQYFKTGTVSGAFDLTPNESSDVTSFESQTWTGTITVLGGTGTYKGIKGKKNTGVFNCSSPDNVHMSCTETIKVKPSPSMLLAIAAAKG